MHERSQLLRDRALSIHVASAFRRKSRNQGDLVASAFRRKSRFRRR